MESGSAVPTALGGLGLQLSFHEGVPNRPLTGAIGGGAVIFRGFGAVAGDGFYEAKVDPGAADLGTLGGGRALALRLAVPALCLGGAIPFIRFGEHLQRRHADHDFAGGRGGVARGTA